MLALGRTARQRVVIFPSSGEMIVVEILEALGNGKVRLGFAAPQSVKILREEVCSDEQRLQASEIAGDATQPRACEP